MVMGPKELRRCTNKPVTIATENKPGEAIPFTRFPKPATTITLFND